MDERPLVVLLGIHVRRQLGVELDLPNPVRVRLDELPDGFVPVQTSEIPERLLGEDERMAEATPVRADRRPRPFVSPFRERPVYETRQHARLVAKEQKEGFAIVSGDVETRQQRRGAARAVGCILHHLGSAEGDGTTQLARGAAEHDIMRQTRHKDSRTLRRYRREGRLWINNITENLGL